MTTLQFFANETGGFKVVWIARGSVAMLGGFRLKKVWFFLVVEQNDSELAGQAGTVYQHELTNNDDELKNRKLEDVLIGSLRCNEPDGKKNGE